MSKSLKIGLALYIIIFPCMAQNQLIGEWTNSYGSLMTIVSQSKGILRGIYSSSTGSTGKYEILGTYAPSPSGTDLSVGITILWNSTDSTTKDPSQFWTSVMIGAYYGEKKVMELINQIAAAEAFDVVSVLEPGVYPESLTFTKKQGTPETPSPPIQVNAPGAKGSDIYRTAIPSQRLFRSIKKNQPYRTSKRYTVSSLNGTWKNREDQSTITIRVFGEILQASISMDGKKIPAIGLVAKPAKNFQSLSIASLPISTSGALWGITGLLDIHGDTLKLVVSQSRAVAYKNKYAATNVNIFNFERVMP